MMRLQHKLDIERWALSVRRLRRFPARPAVPPYHFGNR